MEILKVSSRSNPNSVAGALAGVVRQSGAVEVQVVGAGALNQAVKAIAIARGYVVPSGLDLVCIPTFADIEIDGESRTAIRLSIEDRNRRMPNGVEGPAVSVAGSSSSSSSDGASGAPEPVVADAAAAPVPAAAGAPAAADFVDLSDPALTS